MDFDVRGMRLRIQDLRKSFGDVEVLRGIDLELAPGEFIAVVGQSGCGKSTLLRHIAGLEKATSGRVLLDDETLQGLNPHARVMFQDPRLLPWEKVLENVGVGLGLKGNWREKAHFALQQVGLANRATEWPAVLSGGQRQRVALARALATEPRLLLLDEPLGALDALTRIEMQELIEGIWKKQRFTALLVTHDVGEAIALADRVILIEKGKITMDLRVPLQRPRERGSAAFAKLEGKVLARVMGKDDLLLNATTPV